jgi:hypothetical protein
VAFAVTSEHGAEVRDAHPSKIAKGGAASGVVVQRWPSPLEDVEGESPKEFGNVDICVCWGKVGTQFKGYELEPITESNLDERKFPGVTHLLRRDGDIHVVSVVMLQTITEMISSGKLSVAVRHEEIPDLAGPPEPPSRDTRKKRR